MEVHGLAALREARLRLTTEGGAHVLVLHEPSSGRLLKLSRAMASAFLAIRGRPSEDQRLAAASLAGQVSKLRAEGVKGSGKFNPLFFNIPLFSLTPVQPALRPLANALFSRAGAVALALMILLAAWVSAFSDFALVSRLGEVFSLDALVTFALLAPFLKILHEFGHLLAATRFGVPVRKAGLLLVALYPLPFVDCTEAEWRASRAGRVTVSLAGLLADIAIGVTAFLLWHFTEDPWLRQLFGNIFVFNTVTTVLFNLNPLMKLDGYFALSDLLHRRNYHYESTRAVSAVRSAIAKFDFGGTGRAIAAAPGKLTFAAASMAYKVYILAFIAWTLMPQYLGLGLVVVVWGFALMFLVPAFASSPSDEEGGATRRWLWRGGIVGLLALISLIPAPHWTNVQLRLDVVGAYQLRAGAQGAVVDIRQAGPVTAGEILATQSSEDDDHALKVAHADLELYEMLLEASRGVDPLAVNAAQERVATSRDHVARLSREAEARTIRAPSSGWFWPDATALPGAALGLGAAIGVLTPDAETSKLTGVFPEIYAEKFRSDLTGLTLLGAGGEQTGQDGVTARLARADQSDDVGVRGFVLKVDAPLPPVEAARDQLHLQLTFEEEPLWAHALFHFQRLRLEFLQSQDLARRRALE